MPKVCFIRHAESEANVGARTQDPGLIPLTPNGVRQAEELARTIIAAPELIITTRYSRTVDTAAPTVRKFPNVPREIWGFHEFTYLAPSKIMDTTFAERTPLAEAYWRNGDPLYRDGDDAESFADFVARCTAEVRRLRALPRGPILVFSHIQTITAVKWIAAGRLEGPLNQKTMHDFRAYLIACPVKNCEKVEFDL